MAFYSVKDTQSKFGTVYIMEFIIDGMKVHKVGITTQKPIDRMLEILRSFHKVNRYVPECKLLRFRTHIMYKEIEKQLHIENKYDNLEFDKPFGGSTEFFQLGDLGTLLDRYEELLGNELELNEYEYMPEWGYLADEREQLQSRCYKFNKDTYTTLDVILSSGKFED